MNTPPHEASALGRLWLRPLDQSFDPSRDRVIAPWCVASAESRWPDWEAAQFADPWSDADAIHDEAEACVSLTRYLSARMAPTYARRHGRPEDPVYWLTVLRPWILVMAQFAWGHWRSVEKAVEQMGEEALSVELAPEVVDWQFVDFNDLHDRGTMTLDFATWLSSLAVQHLASPRWILTKHGLSPPPAPTPPTPRRGLRSFVRRRLRMNTVAGASIGDRMMFSALLWAAPRRPPSPRIAVIFPQKPPDVFPEAFLHLLDQVLACTEPWILKDGYAVWAAEAGRRRYSKGALLVGFDLFSGAEDILVAAQAEADGARVVPVQHGGNYGLAACDVDAAELEYTHDAFITWGWTRHGDYPGNFVPLPSPRLSSITDRHEERDTRLVLVSTQQRLHDLRPRSWPQPTQWLKARREKVAFFSALPEAIRRQSAFRPYSSDESNLESLSYLRAHFPDLEVVEGSLWKNFLQCRLVVLDHPGTGLNETLAAGVPTICLWDPKAWSVTEDVDTIFDLFREAGMFADNGAAAGALVSRIWDDVPGWWNSEPVRRARDVFIDRYSKSSAAWRWAWARALWNL